MAEALSGRRSVWGGGETANTNTKQGKMATEVHNAPELRVQVVSQFSLAHPTCSHPSSPLMVSPPPQPLLFLDGASLDGASLVKYGLTRMES